TTPFDVTAIGILFTLVLLRSDSISLLVLLHTRMPNVFPYTTLFRSHAERLPVSEDRRLAHGQRDLTDPAAQRRRGRSDHADRARSEEHTTELQSRGQVVCRLLLEKRT